MRDGAILCKMVHNGTGSRKMVQHDATWYEIVPLSAGR